MDRLIAPEVKRRKYLLRVAVVVAAVGVTAIALAAGIDWLRPSVSRRGLQTATVTRGSVHAAVRANGIVVPVIEQVVSSPIEARVLRIERRAGEPVRIGDELLTLDTSVTRLEAARLDDKVVQKENSTSELRLRLDESIAALEAQIEQKRLDLEILQYAADQRTRLRSEGLIAEQDALGAKAAARKSAIELRQLEEALLRTLDLRKVQLQSSESELVMARRERDESRRQLDLSLLRAETNGVLTSIISETGATVRRGDIVARIADLSAYRVEATVSDIHAARLSAGLRTVVILDGLRLGGEIESVDPRIVNGVARFQVTLDEPAHSRLRNNMRAEISVFTERRDNVLTVKRGAIGRSEYGFVIRGSHAERVPINFGVTGDETIEIITGAAEGDELVISDMKDFEDVSSVKLR
jgi:HlyD family secretion protein